MLSLNKDLTRVQGEASPGESRTEMVPQIEAHLAASEAPQAVARPPKFDPSELADLLMLLQEPPNDLPGSPNLECLNSNQARLPSDASAFSYDPATGWIGTSSGVVPVHAAHLATSAVDVEDGGGAAVSDVTVMSAKHERVVEEPAPAGAGGGLSQDYNPVSQYQTTMDLDCHTVSDGESDSSRPRNTPDNIYCKCPRCTVEHEEAPFQSAIFRLSTNNVAARLAEEYHLREVAFNASFKLETERCTPLARCRKCLAFCQMRLPSSQGGFGGLEREESPPVWRYVEGDEGRLVRKTGRHGPKSKSSEYRGVTYYKRTGRWEAHIWHDGAQVYLGASLTKEAAARVYDQAALMLFGPTVDVNFVASSYRMEMAYLHKLTKEQLVIYLRRDSRGLGVQVPYPGVKHVKNLYQASCGPLARRKLLGTFTVEEDAARAVYKEALLNSFGGLANLILDTHHIRNMPSFASGRFGALYPGALDYMPRRNEMRPLVSKRPSVLDRAPPPQTKRRFTIPERKTIHELTSPPVIPRVVEQLPGNKIDECIEVSPGALRPDRTWGAHQLRKTFHQKGQRHAPGVDPVAPQHFQSGPHQLEPSNGINTLTPQQLKALLPKLDRPLATPAGALSSYHALSVPSSVRSSATGEVSSSGVIKFKLFNVEISVKAVQDYECN